MNVDYVLSLSFRASCERAAQAIANGWSPFPPDVMKQFVDLFGRPEQLELPL